VKIIEIKAFSGQVLDGLNLLLPQLSEAAAPITAGQLRRIIASPCTRLFMAMDEGRYVATMALVFYPLPTGLRARLEDVVVDMAERGKGLGRQLIAHALETARAGGARALDLTSNPSRHAAHALHQKMGFERRDTHLFVHALG
jgi:GNAT superfamily N-acetyltransferase